MSVAPANPPEWWAEGCAQLSKRDPILKRFIKQYGAVPVRLQSRGDAFSTLARSIIGQQISTKAADAVWDKFLMLVGKAKPSAVLEQELDALRRCGLSARKADYLLDLARRYEAGELHHNSWRSMSDEEVIAELIAVRGIGRWTAEMFLIFYLQRPNVFPIDDLGLTKGLALHYSGGVSFSRSQAREIAELWSPWATIGTWYIWRSIADA